MKSAYLLLNLCAVISACISVYDLQAQCPNGQVSQSVSYAIRLTGGGNNNYSFDFPQFDPSIGTLVKVDIQTIITVKYNYTLENTDTVPINYKVRVHRTDDIICSALAAPLTNFQAVEVRRHFLNAFDGVTGSGPDYTSVGPVFPFNHFVNNYSFTNNVAGFLGNGNVQFDYSSTTDSYPSGSSHYLYNTNANDSVDLNLVYYYCVTSLLPANISNFTAVRMAAGNIRLSWLTPADMQGKQFQAEKSADGSTFVTFETISSSNSNAGGSQATYTVQKKDKKKLFFRIKQLEENGNVKYSEIKTVMLPEPKEMAMLVYPTEVTSGLLNVYFPNGVREDWIIQIISMSGEVKQQAMFVKSNFLKITLNHRLPKGIYLVNVLNVKTRESQKAKIMVNM